MAAIINREQAAVLEYMRVENEVLRAVTPRPSQAATVVSLPRLGGLHHRYEWREAA